MLFRSGVPGYESAQWYGLWAPAGTPREVVAWLHKEIVTVLRTPAMKERFAELGLDVIASTPDEFAATIKSDIAKWTRLVKTSGMALL